MAKDFENKVALVTGASRASDARRRHGSRKAARRWPIAYAGNDAAANEAKAECERREPAVMLLKFDVANPEAGREGDRRHDRRSWGACTSW